MFWEGVAVGLVVNTSFLSTLDRVFGLGVIESVTPLGLADVELGGVAVVSEGDGGADVDGGVAGVDGVMLGFYEISEEGLRLGTLTKVGGAFAPGR